ncbi:MAG: proline racemase family protein [Megasphaera massiliensis]|jgi:proline racemase|uniref:proline racemase family protein n=1 Tax=Megasphaera massiliensis TaxID=1232428 RepID=UPI002A74BE3F|nr:proline racemase family protein [Megasphaera massiliensis]MDY2965990.1 proline racemase family protein [Megasphaera massiliensis]
MKFTQMLTAIDTHTAGEAARLIIGGIPKFPGKTMAEKRHYLETHKDGLRKSLMLEPRGHQDMFGAFICEPANEEADYGIIFMDSSGYLNMCGHNTIAAMTVAVECGWVDVPQGASQVKVVQDTPAGLIHGTVHLNPSGDVEFVSFENVPSFLYKKDISIFVPSLEKEVVCDISFGGNFFALVSAEQVDLDICPKNSEVLCKIGMEIRDGLNQNVRVQHPILQHIAGVDEVEFYGPAKSKEADFQNFVAFGDSQVDRSPCGTGTSAKIAFMHAKNLLNVGDSVICESVLETKFKGEIVKECKVGDYAAIIPRISGTASIVGFNTFLVDPKDPLKQGFLLK